MINFEVGKTYYTRSKGDHNCVWTFKVTARTEATITIEEVDGKIKKKCRVAKYSKEFGAEIIKFSKSDSLSADRVA